jgi:hypothetical protein
MRIGSDPEFFLQQNNNPVAVCGLINHDKWNPLQYPDMPNGYTVQEDNVAVEFGIPPASSAQEFVDHMRKVKARFKKDFKHLTFSKLSAVVFPEDQLQHPMAKVFGCEPDFNAWTKNVNPKPNAANPSLRSAGGHVHVETKLEPFSVGRAMDCYLGVPSVLMDSGELRKQLYGKHGAMRVKPYGMEYRVLSNFWCHEEKLMRWVWRNTKRALDFLEVGGSVDHLHTEIKQCIDNNDKGLAQHLVHELNLEVV